MKKLLLPLILIFAAYSSGNAQDNLSYADKAAQIQKDVWGTPIPEFKATAIPANLSKESAVILARSFSLQRTSNGRLKFMIITAGSTTRTIKMATYHERVKLNDKAALDEFSTLEYQKTLDKTVNLLITKFAEKHNTYIGVKIIKPNGKEVIVNTGEEVLLKNEQKDQQGKLAIPGLEVGDIIDYYISTYDLSEKMDADSYKDNDYLFILGDQHPILYYTLDFQFNKKISVQKITANGAPNFTESTNDAGDQIYSLRLHNLPKYSSTLWTSPLRQYPYIELASQYTSKFNNFVMGEKNYEDMSRFDANKQIFEDSFIEEQGFDWPEKYIRNQFKNNKAYKEAPLDTTVRMLYDQIKAASFCYYSADDLQNIADINYRSMQSLLKAREVALVLTDMKVDYNVLLVASRNSNTLQNSFSMRDFSAMIVINDAQPMYMCFDDAFTHFNEIPERFQGETAVSLAPERHNAHKYTFSEGTVNIPVIGADKNTVNETMQVSFLPGNMQKLKISRTVTETGAMRHAGQRFLVPVQDVDNTLAAMGKRGSLEERLKTYQETKKMFNDFDYAFTKQASDLTKNCTTEIKDQYDQQPEKVESCKIIEPAIKDDNPDFQYSETFVLNNLVKKAGDNYIIDAGKLTGDFYKLEEKERKRTVDVYLTSAHSFKYAINITIPAGYSVKGLEEITIKKANKTGLFSSTATVNGNTLTIAVNRVYNHNFEKIADWPMVTELLDAASNFNSQKILLAKN